MLPEMIPRQQNPGSTLKQMAMLLTPHCQINCICYALTWAWQETEKAVGRVVNSHPHKSLFSTCSVAYYFVFIIQTSINQTNIHTASGENP
jgi:hypothetical protein